MIGTVVHVKTFQQNHMMVNGSILRCLFKDGASFILQTATLGIPLYHFIIRPLLHKITKSTPSMLKLIGIAHFLNILACIGMVAIETIGHLETPNVTCMFNDTINKAMSLNYYWTIIPQVLQGFGGVFAFLFSFKFIIAQSPYQMKGFLFGLFYAFNGIARVFGYNLYHLFQLLPQSIPISCGFYYYLTQTILFSLVFIIFLILSKHYKLRVRDNPVNIHMIAETHITAYIDQEEEHGLETGQENESNISSSDSEDIYA